MSQHSNWEKTCKDGFQYYLIVHIDILVFRLLKKTLFFSHIQATRFLPRNLYDLFNQGLSHILLMLERECFGCQCSGLISAVWICEKIKIYFV